MIIFILLLIWNNNQITLDPGRQTLDQQNTSLQSWNLEMASQREKQELCNLYVELGLIQQKVKFFDVAYYDLINRSLSL